jgi:hypothetical protein
MNELVTGKRAEMTGNVLLYWQNIEYLDNLFRRLGHRTPLTPLQGRMPMSRKENGHIEDTVGLYVHFDLDDHTYRTFNEERGSGIPLALLHAANSDARMWRNQLADADVTKQGT